MLWEPFLIKKLLKSVICGTVNSMHMHCLPLTKSTIASLKKKKKKKRREKRRRGFQHKANGHIIIVWWDGTRFFLFFFFFAMTAFVPLFVPFSAMVIDRSRSIGHVFSLKLSHRHRMMGLRSSGVQLYRLVDFLFLHFFFIFIWYFIYYYKLLY